MKWGIAEAVSIELVISFFGYINEPAIECTVSCTTAQAGKVAERAITCTAATADGAVTW
jgi:hypothetical protein